MRLRRTVGQPGNSSIISRVKLGQTTVQLGKKAGFDDVGHRLGLTTGAQISVCKTPCLSTGFMTFFRISVVFINATTVHDESTIELSSENF